MLRGTEDDYLQIITVLTPKIQENVFRIKRR